MYGYIYKTTNLINNKIYVGQHRVKDDKFDTSYIGSGKLLLEAVSKYGKDNFSCELLEWCETEEILNDKEIYYISLYKSTVAYDNYNITPGGPVPRLFGENNGNFGKHRNMTNEEKQHLSEVLSGHKPTFTGHHTEETKARLHETTTQYNLTRSDYDQISKQHTGSKMLTNGIEQHWFYGDDVDAKLKEGWVVGSCKKRKNKTYKNGVNPLIGRKRNPTTSNTVGINNGEINRFVPKEQLDEYLSNGWILGMKKRTNS